MAAVLALALLATLFVVAGAGPAAAAPPIGTVDSFPFGPGLQDARELIPGPDGNLWFVSPASDVIGRITPAGAVTMFAHPDVIDPLDIAAGPDGNLWFVAYQWAPGVRGTIGRLTPTGTFTLFPSTSVHRPTSIVPGPDGKLWFTDAESPLFPGGQVGTITTAGVITAQPTGDDGFYPDEVVFASDGRPWLSGGGHIGITSLDLNGVLDLSRTTDLRGSDLVPGPAGSMWLRGTSTWPAGPDGVMRLGPEADETRVERFAPGVTPADLVAGTGGSAWFADPTGSIGLVAADGSITTSPTPGATPGSLTVGPDGSVWFLGGGSAIGRVQADGHVDTFAATGTVSTPLVIGPDDDLWFADGATAIGRIAAAPEAGVPVFVEAVPGKGQATVSWAAPRAPVEAITGYSVVATPGGAGCTTTGALTCTVGPLTAGTSYSFTVRPLGAGGPGPASAASNAVLPWSGSTYHSVPPTRILDSRLPNVGFAGRVTSTSPRRLQVTGVGGPANVPASATAVVMNVTVTDSTTLSYLTVYPTGTSRPNASNLNFGRNQVIPNLVTVRIGIGGSVEVATAAGSTHVVADIVGYHDDGTGTDASGAGGRFVPVAPVRLLDSRLPEPWGGPLEAGVPRGLDVRASYSATNPIPWTATGVVVNVTVTNADFQSFLTVYPGGSPPGVSNLNFLPGQTIANLAVVGVGRGDAEIRFANAIGSVDVVVDMVGYLDPTAGSRFHATDPTRVLDTRTGVGFAGTQGPGQIRPLRVAGTPGTGVPAGATGIVANLTVADATAESYASIFPGSQARPDPFSNVNFGRDQVIPNLTTVGVAPDGTVNLYNHLGRTHLIADVVGWYAPW